MMAGNGCRIMDFIVRKAGEGDRTAVIDIFNHFVENSFAAFPEKKLDYEFFDKLKAAARGNSFYVIEVPELPPTTTIALSPPPAAETPTSGDAPAAVMITEEPKKVGAAAEKKVIGFALLKTHHPIPVFDRTADMACFILPEYVNKGFGTLLLELLLADAKAMGIDNVLAEISSLNDASLKFHHKKGFSECGRLKKIGRKNGKDFDVVWMQKSV